MEPDTAAEYNKQAYWDQRYAREAVFDWFETVYRPCLLRCIEALEALDDCSAEAADEHQMAAVPIRVLHLGCGNSKLCGDLAAAWADSGRCRPLHQIAVDYSPVVIENMKQAPHCQGAVVDWLVDDVRVLGTVASDSIDLVLDKGTMDALQADKDNDDMDDDIDAMLKQVSRVCRQSKALFLQFTWEIPYYRQHYTKRPEYAWGATTPVNAFLGDSDLYRCYVYSIGAMQKGTEADPAKSPAPATTTAVI